MKIRIGDDGILIKAVNGQTHSVNCSQSQQSGRNYCGVACAKCNEELQEVIDKRSKLVVGMRNVVVLTCGGGYPTVLPLEEPLIQPVSSGLIVPTQEN